MNNDELLTFTDSGKGMLEATLNLGTLYRNEPKERCAFEGRYKDFIKNAANSSKAYNGRKIFIKEGDLLVYQTEQIIIPKCNGRKPLLLLFGNPASHSISDGMFFAYKNSPNGKKTEHPLWEVLREKGFLVFESDNTSNEMSIEERSQIRKDELYELKYEEPFCLSLAVYYTMPSPASGNWGYVEGLSKLFGTKALREIEKSEQQIRINPILEMLSRNDGSVLAFHSYPWNGLKSEINQVYDFKEALKGNLVGACRKYNNVRLLCSPPTRDIRWPSTKNVLVKFYKMLNTHN